MSTSTAKGIRSLGNYAEGNWIESGLKKDTLFHAVTGEPYALAGSDGLDFAAMMKYARTKGGPVLRKMTFHERGRMIRSLALYLFERKDLFYSISAATGASKQDSWVDIEGGIGNLFSYASLRRQFPDQPYALDGDTIKVSKGGSFSAHHVCVPKQGVALHINAFNFPVWGMLEKTAVNWLAGVPAIVKPATATSYLTEAVVREIIASGILPEGALQLICGSARGILDSIESQDVVTFTGSADTGRMLKAHPRILSEAVPFNMEADSLNCCILGEDVEPGSADFDVFIKEVHREMVTKAGQRCTAVRRILVPDSRIDAVRTALVKKLSQTVVGDPSAEGVRMGPLATRNQLDELLSKVKSLSETQEVVYGSQAELIVKGAEKDKGYFASPFLFYNDRPFEKTDCHEVEAFGPVSTLIPYRTTGEAVELANMGKGSLVSSIVTSNDKIAREYVLGSAAYHGRILILNERCAKENTGHGSPLPMLVHGGPGRAGGGEEMGGKRGVFHYLQRTALQGHPDMLSKVLQNFQPGGDYIEKVIHPFAQYFEDLEVGETLITAKRTVTESDLVNFSNVSWDHFYAHTDATSLEGTIFEQRVAHGYFILSAAAGLFVNAKKGPVLLNYGIDECRFTKPVYPGSTIGVKLTVKEKIAQEKKTEEDVAKGIVKWLVDVYDETGETVAIATILTMVKMRKQD